LRDAASRMKEAKQEAERCWHRDSTRHLAFIPQLADEFAKLIAQYSECIDRLEAELDEERAVTARFSEWYSEDGCPDPCPWNRQDLIDDWNRDCVEEDKIAVDTPDLELLDICGRASSEGACYAEHYRQEYRKRLFKLGRQSGKTAAVMHKEVQ